MLKSDLKQSWAMEFDKHDLEIDGNRVAIQKLFILFYFIFLFLFYFIFQARY